MLASAWIALPAAAKTDSTATSFDYKSWDAYAGGADSSQYSSLDQVNTGNVGQLQVAWTFETGPGQAPHFNPIKIGDTLYLIAGSKLVALDPVTGRKKWDKDYGGRIGDRGMNYWQSADGKDHRLYFLKDGMLTAVNADNGEIVTSFGTNGQVDIRTGLEASKMPAKPLMTSNPGRIYKNTIIISLPAAAYDFASAPADTHAYDVLTGKLKWVFHTVPEKGEAGYETWPAKDHDKFGGVHNWSEFTVDSNAGIAYIPTGTARYDFYGGNREGMNLHANSINAVDIATGKLLWSFQVVHHDLWDFDIPQSPKLMTIHKDGKDIPVVIQATKHGFVFVFDRRTGKPIWPVVEKKVPASDVPGEQASPTQPVPTWPLPFARQQKMTVADINPYVSAEDQAKLRELVATSRNEGMFTPPSLRGTIVWPGHNGGTSWGGTAIDPVNKRFFVVSREIPVLEKLTPDTKPESAANMPNGGGDVTPYTSAYNFMFQSNGMVAVKPPFSYLTAYDMNTGKRLYHIPDGEAWLLQQKGITGVGSQAPRGGPVATAGGLLFVGTSGDRTFRARDAATGKVLWEYNIGAGTEGVPAVYEAGGREYITVPVGGEGLFPHKGLPAPGPSRYVTFALPAR